MWKDYISVASVDDALNILAHHGNRARIVAGATDLILEMERGARSGIEILVDVSRIPDLDKISYDDSEGVIRLGALVTHNQCVASKLIRDRAYPLARACWEVGSPQIRNRGTIVGNLVTASPANDTITPLVAMGAYVVLRSNDGLRKVSLNEFYRGVRKTILNPEEMVVEIGFKAIGKNQRGAFIKYALRQAQAISLVNVAVILTMVREHITAAQITLGAVAPTIIHALDAEQYLIGQRLSEETIQTAAKLTAKATRPISDVRASARYRTRMAKTITKRALQSLASGSERVGMPDQPILLMGDGREEPSGIHGTVHHDSTQPIMTRINGKDVILQGGQQKSLLRLLREEAGLTGSKEGCAEGECGACTVFLDGMAVMSCMVPAPRAHGADIVTIEGLGKNGELHPVQSAFIEKGAVQCGYCTPGFLMSAAKLLEECQSPDGAEIRQAFTGNLCRCTGYYQIIEAVELATTNFDSKPFSEVVSGQEK